MVISLNIAIHLDKSDLDFQLVSLSKQNDMYNKLLYYCGEKNNEIMELKHEIEIKIERLIKLYKII